MDYLGYYIRKIGRDWAVYDWDYESEHIVFIAKNQSQAMAWIERRSF